uniref:Secreted protein n=1 Tax=Panagrolaimus sp. JU765 TaxID=591449 RepID=A0AC34QAY5_9BILA
MIFYMPKFSSSSFFYTACALFAAFSVPQKNDDDEVTNEPNFQQREPFLRNFNIPQDSFVRSKPAAYPRNYRETSA